MDARSEHRNQNKTGNKDGRVSASLYAASRASFHPPLMSTSLRLNGRVVLVAVVLLAMLLEEEDEEDEEDEVPST
tara:strand:+ start:662 stop:886 length:225 start_codon:yes stop_codon:yes gene_type:complete